MICLKFIILEPRGSRSVASSINGRLSSLLLSLPDVGWGTQHILVALDGVIKIILIVLTCVTDQNE
jgi:hypothetical protein